MFRKLTLVSAVSLALLPGAVGALGLGGIGAESALNEPFSAHIELLDVQPDDLPAVKVLLASEAEFDKAGAPRPDFLDQLNFSTGVSAQGQSRILVTSKVPVREPYLDFLIEVTWPNGRLIQEYTVLLDPPVTVDRAPPPIAPPAMAAPEPPQPVVRSVPTPPPQPSQAPQSADAEAFPLRHGPVKPGASLWRIARKMAQSSGASVSQTAMALYRNNQEAFIRGDIHKLKVGKVLEIPTAAELTALDAVAADREFQAALRGESVTSTPITDITAAPRPEDRLQIAGAAAPAPSAGTTAEAPPEAPTGPEVASDVAEGEPAPLPPGAETEVGDAEPALGAIEQDLLLVQEAGESTRQETEELRNRVLELETQLADIQTLLKLSNERFAQLQSVGLDQSRMVGAEEPDLPLPVVPEEPATVAGEGESDEPAAQSIPDEAVVAQGTPAETETPAGDADKVPAQAPAAVSFWESIAQNTWALVVAVPTLLLILGWMIRKRRKNLEESLRPADLTLDAQEEGAAAGLGGAAAKAEEASESSGMSAPTLSPYGGFGSLEGESEEADVISEADVYIAYGRYREAESLLEDEILKSPERMDVKYKLAGVYYGARNLQGMETLMAELQRAGGHRVDPDQWRRLNTMVRDLAGPDAEESGPAAKAPEPTQRFAPSFRSPVSPSSEKAPVSSTPDFGTTAALSTAAPSMANSQDRLSQELELELEVEDFDVITGGLETRAGEETLEMSGAASDLELQLEDLESLRDVDLATFTSRVPSVESLSVESPAQQMTDIEGDSLDIAPVGKDSLASDVLSSQWQMDSGMWDEVATKIDLARAYMEMEDPEAAKVILEEVAQEGNEGQRAEAKEMMAQLS